MPRMTHIDDMMTTGEVASKFHVAGKTVREWVKQGKLRAYATPGGRYRFKHSEVEAFLEETLKPVEPTLVEAKKAPPKKKKVKKKRKVRR